MLAPGEPEGHMRVRVTTKRLGGRAAAPAIAGLLVASWLSAAPGIAAPAAPEIGRPAPNFALTTQQSDRLWLTQLRGRIVVLAFGCAGCGACPGLLDRLAEVERGLGDAPGRRVFFAMVTADPARDTPAALRAFGRARGLRAPAWILLTEDRHGQVEAVARLYGVDVRRQGDRVDVDCTVVLIDGAGVLRSRHGPDSIDALADDLRALLGRPATP
jgi:cytochrome oxidase Cu insertion factor (SCO1/SenC/PrrC family)